jgi:ketosteroid isomerase-like protein
MSVSKQAFDTSWIVGYFAMVDTRDLDEFLAWYSDDASLRFGNQAAMRGKAAIRAGLTEFYSLITSMRHEQIGCWADAGSGAFEAIAHFTTLDGRHVALPAVTTLRLRDGLTHEVALVMDAAPLMHSATATTTPTPIHKVS